MSRPVESFLAALASSAPAPGGGAAAALCAALAAGLVAMVSRVTMEREPSTKDQADSIAVRAAELQQRLAALVDEDMAAYRGVIESRASGAAAVEHALRRATDAPLDVARMGREVLHLCETLAPRARRSAVSDLGVAVSLAWSAVESGALTARVNLKASKDAEYVRVTALHIDRLTSEGAASRQRASSVVSGRLESD